MKSKELFSIPVYAISEKRLNAKCERLRQEYRLTHADKFTKEELNTGEYLYTKNLNHWKYNHIVGYICVSINKSDNFLDLYTPVDKIVRYIPSSSKKTFIKKIQIIGNHFRIAEMNSNDEIRKGIKDYLKMIKDNHIPKRYYVDFTEIENVLNYIDFVDMKQDL